jgi:hypothetical protein
LDGPPRWRSRAAGGAWRCSRAARTVCAARSARSKPAGGRGLVLGCDVADQAAVEEAAERTEHVLGADRCVGQQRHGDHLLRCAIHRLSGLSPGDEVIYLGTSTLFRFELRCAEDDARCIAAA